MVDLAGPGTTEGGLGKERSGKFLSKKDLSKGLSQQLSLRLFSTRLAAWTTGTKRVRFSWMIVEDWKDGKKENFRGRVQKLELVRARWNNKQAGASQCWQERDTATSHMTNTNSELASELPVIFLLEGD